MQVKLFTIPVGENGQFLDEMNAFLRSNKIIEVEDHFASNENGAYWCFCVRYIEHATVKESVPKRDQKIDYRKVLDKASFQRFSRLREIRKKIAQEEGIAAFVVFTDAELAELSGFDLITQKSMLGIKGIGEKKVARYGKYFISSTPENEKSGPSD